MAIVNANGEPIDNIEDVIFPAEPVVQPSTTSTEPPTPPAQTFVGGEPYTTGEPTPATPATPAATDDLGADPFVEPTEPDPAEPGEGAQSSTTEPKPDEGEGAEPSEMEVFYSGVKDILVDEGLFEGDATIKTKEDFVNAMEKTIQSSMDERMQKVEEYMKAGLPYEAVAKVEAAITAANGITDEVLEADENLSEKLVMQGFIDKGFNKEQAKEYFDMFKEKGVHVQEARKSLDERKTLLKQTLDNEVEKVRTNQTQATQNRLDVGLKVIESIESGKILGRRVAPTTQQRLKSSLNTVVAHTEEGQPLNAMLKYKLENPIDFETNMLYLYELTDGFKSLKVFERQAETKISRHFQNSVSNISSGKSFSNTSSPSKTTIDLNKIDDIIIPD